MGYVDGANSQTYVRHAPIVAVDPSGLVWMLCCANQINTPCNIRACPQAFVGPPTPICGLSDWDVQEALGRATSACNGRPPTITCLATCGTGGGLRCADTTPTIPPAISVCPGTNPACPTLRQMLLHELEHARQFCIRGGDFTSCRDRICGELEAYHQAQCARGGDPSSCCTMACSSVNHDTWCIVPGGCQVACEAMVKSGQCSGGGYHPPPPRTPPNCPDGLCVPPSGPGHLGPR